MTSALSQTATATTDPVGYITLNVTGSHNTGNAALSFVAQGMTRPVEFQSTAKSVSGRQVTDTSASFTDDQYNVVTNNGTTTGDAYYLEVVSGTGAGLWSDIVSTNGASTTHSGTPNTLTLSNDLSAYLTAGTSYRIRKNWTISAIFGTDPTATGASGLLGGTSTTADQVLLYTPATYDANGNQTAAGAYTTYYYKTTGIGGTGWRSTASNSADASKAKLEPTQGILVQRKGTSDLAFTLVGAVKTGTTDLQIAQGLNIVSNVYPSGTLTLASSGLYNASNSTNSLVGGTSTTADQVLLYTPATYDANGNQTAAGAYTTYYYKTTGIGGTGWRSTASNSADASGTTLPFGTSILVQKKNKGANSDGSFDWLQPQPF